MKKLFSTALFAASMLAATHTFAQTHKDTASVSQKVGTTAKKSWKATKKTASKVGNKTAELASKGASAVNDKKYDAKVGPAGQTIYIDRNSAYYYVNKKGRHIYVPKAQLVDKPIK